MLSLVSLVMVNAISSWHSYRYLWDMHCKGYPSCCQKANWSMIMDPSCGLAPTPDTHNSNSGVCWWRCITPMGRIDQWKMVTLTWRHETSHTFYKPRHPWECSQFIWPIKIWTTKFAYSIQLQKQYDNIYQ